MTANYQRWKNIMKCYPFEEKRLAKWQPPYIVQPKYDGVRCRAVPLDNGSYVLLSSEENIIYSVPHINEDLEQSQLPRWEYDGELYCHGMSFQDILSITSRTVNLHNLRTEIKFHIFDVVAEQQHQMERLVALVGQQREIKSRKYLRFAPFWMCENLEEVMRAYDKLINSQYEGIIVRHSHGLYLRKRSMWVMKFKPKKEDTYDIIGWKEETSNEGAPKGRIGALVCQSCEGDTFSVGTGFTDEMREMLWERRGNLTGRHARVSYQHLTTGKKVPRFPVFVEVLDV